MGDILTTVVFWLGTLLLVGFIVLGLSSRSLRRHLQEPADRMLEADRRRWGHPGAREGRTK